MLPQTVSPSLPRGVTSPSPVTTTRRINPSPTLFPQQNCPPASPGAVNPSAEAVYQALFASLYEIAYFPLRLFTAASHEISPPNSSSNLNTSYTVPML